MDFCILGLLLSQDMTLYEIKIAFERGLGLFYASSFGSLQTTLRKLLKDGLIEIASQEKTGRKRRYYRITSAGRRYFEEEIVRELPAARMEETALARVYFLGHVDGPTRLRVLDGIIHRIEGEIANLKKVESSLEALSPDEAERARFPLHTLDYGLRSFRSAREWFKNLRNQEAHRTPGTDEIS